MKKGFFSSLFLAATCAALVVAGLPGRLSSQAPDYKPKRINRAIELLEQGQPIYYTTASAAGYEEGKKLAGTWADYITYEMEHGAFDISKLREFMRGLADGGPTKSGHRTPAVICTLPVQGVDAATISANSWMVEQVLGSGVHGILLVHARNPAAVKAFVRAARYPFHKPAPGIEEGLRGSGGQGFASGIWGVSGDQYLQMAEPWPLNPKGEILLGLKIEDRHALANAEASTKVPGIGFAEWGPGDMGMSLGFPSNHDEPYPQSMQEARARVLAACKAAKIAFLNQMDPDNVEMRIKEGVMIGAGNQEAAEKGRRHTKRQMPW